MKIIVDFVTDDEAFVSVDDVPEDCTDGDVHWSVEQVALAGDSVAQLALELMGQRAWIDLTYPRVQGHRRVYRDGSFDVL